jgi:hypothetical protein
LIKYTLMTLVLSITSCNEFMPTQPSSGRRKSSDINDNSQNATLFAEAFADLTTNMTKVSLEDIRSTPDAESRKWLINHFFALADEMASSKIEWTNSQNTCAVMASNNGLTTKLSLDHCSSFASNKESAQLVLMHAGVQYKGVTDQTLSAKIATSALSIVAVVKSRTANETPSKSGQSSGEPGSRELPDPQVSRNPESAQSISCEFFVENFASETGEETYSGFHSCFELSMPRGLVEQKELSESCNTTAQENNATVMIRENEPCPEYTKREASHVCDTNLSSEPSKLSYKLYLNHRAMKESLLIEAMNDCKNQGGTWINTGN